MDSALVKYSYSKNHNNKNKIDSQNYRIVLVHLEGLAPWADAHGKQRVSAVLSSVVPSDLRKLCLLASPQITSCLA